MTGTEQPNTTGIDYSNPALYQPSQPAPTPPTDAPAKRRWIIPAAIIAVVIVVVAVVLGVTLAGGGTSKMTVIGTVTLTDTSGDSISYPDGAGAACVGTGGYSDLAVGAEVVITDSAGKTLAIGELSTSKAAGTSACVFGFAISGIPKNHDFYGVSVTHRGVVQETKAQMLAGVTLSIGS